MNNFFNSHSKSILGVALATLAILLIALVSLIFYSNHVKSENTALEVKVKELEEGLKNTGDSLQRVEQEKTVILTTLKNEQEKNARYSNQLDTVTNTIESLQRLNQIDPELLQKYSKVYFLNENYVPSELSLIDTKYLYDKSRKLEIHDRVLPFLQSMISDAQKDGVNLLVISAYRSFGTQAALKSSYKVTYGAGTANQFSADQGYSEHQLGTTLDLTTPKVGSTFEGFDKTTAYGWLTENAYKYGFILSYPSHNGYYVYEPWHWRFVGLDLALRLHNEHKNFYDLEQRDISQYLRYIFNATTTPITQ